MEDSSKGDNKVRGFFKAVHSTTICKTYSKFTFHKNFYNVLSLTLIFETNTENYTISTLAMYSKTGEKLI